MISAPEWYGNPVLEVMLLDHDEPTNYEEVLACVLEVVQNGTVKERVLACVTRCEIE